MLAFDCRMPLARWIRWALLSLAVLAPAAAAQVTVHAFVDKTTMGDGETLLYTIEASGPFGDLGQVEPPETRGLTAVQTQPIPEWDVTIRGGQTQQRLRLQWQYRPLGTGQVYLGEATLRLDGRAYTTAPVTVQVVDQAQRPSAALASPGPASSPRPDFSGPADLFIRAEPATATAFLGEQVVVDYVLYFEPSVHPRNSRIASAWDADGFWREELELDRIATPRTITVDGRTFEAAPIKRMAVFPTRTGPLAVDSLSIEIDVMRASGGGRSVFGRLFRSRFERETLTAPRVTVEARPLPSGAPASFSGGVGQFALAVEVDRAEVEAGEPVRVAATVSGTGNIATLDAPTWAVPASFEQYPTREAERIDRPARRLRGEKTFTFTLVPRSGGAFVLPPLAWSYFDPEAEQYRTLRSDSLRLRVLGPAAPLAEASPAETDDALAGPFKTASWQRASAAKPLWASPWLWAGFGLPALAVLGLLAVRHFRERDEESAAARSLRAFPEARHGLDTAAAHLPSNPRAFWSDLDRTLRRFLTDRLGAPAHSLALPDLDRLLAQRGVAPETRSAIVRLLGESGAAPFAPLPAAPPATTADAAARLMAAVNDEAAALS